MVRKFISKPKIEAVGAPTEPPPVEGAPVEYAFLSKSRCPRCGGLNTEAYSTKGSVRYRRCLAPTCRENYKEIGSLV